MNEQHHRDERDGEETFNGNRAQSHRRPQGKRSGGPRREPPSKPIPLARQGRHLPTLPNEDTSLQSLQPDDSGAVCRATAL